MFGRASNLFRDGRPLLSLAWLAGLLEAEGTFMRPPSDRLYPIVACQMTDRDVVERVGHLLGTRVATNQRERRRTIYAAKVKGSRAAQLMRDLAPAMGQRRQDAVRHALTGYVPPQRKLNFAKAEVIRDFQTVVSVSRLAEEFDVARATVRQVLDGSIYSEPEEFPWHACEEFIRGEEAAISRTELHWLAGWLEGEGSFLGPPPSDPRRPRISGKTRDQDVADEVGRLLGVTPTFSHDERERRNGWSPTWRILMRGQPAIRQMKVLSPLLGTRRRMQIESALAAVA